MENKNREIKHVMHSARTRTLTIKKIEQVTAKIRRITFVSDELADFTSLSPDDHIKVFFPYPGEDKPVLPVMGPHGPMLPEGGRRPLMRDYTPRRFDRETCELDIEFFLHGEGPGSSWAQQATVGQQLTIGGPRGSKIVPYNFDWYLMVGDESAIPSFSRRLLELPADSKALVVIETEDESQKIELQHTGQADIHWIYRHGREAGSIQGIKEKLMHLPFFKGDYFAWIALEKTCASAVQDFLLTVKGGQAEWIKATGYWNHHHHPSNPA